MAKRRVFSFLLMICISGVLLSGCQGSTQSGEANSSASPQERGKALVEATMIGESKAPGCVTCHSFEAGKVIIGPSLAGIATVAESAVPGLSAEDFLREAIVDPDAYITEGFPAGVMYKNYGKELSAEQINDIVAYLLTLK